MSIRRPRRRRQATTDQYPYVWTRDQRPAGQKGKRCRITGYAKIGGLVYVEFKGGGRFTVDRSGLERADG